MTRHGNGKWGDPAWPGTGWICEGLTDLRELDDQDEDYLETCEMCEYQRIRYVHHMIHPARGLELDTGSVCASKMESNPSAASAREQELRNVARRRRNWLTRTWRVSAMGHHYLNVDGLNIVVYEVSGGWGGRITERYGTNPRVIRSRRVYTTRDAAKMAAFDTMIWLKARQRDE